MASRSTSALSRPLPRGDRVVSISTFAFLFAEVISYFQSRVTSMGDLETRLESAGAGIGVRFRELSAFRDKPGRRETGVVGMLQFVSGPAWQSLFGKQADALEKSTEVANQYMIREDEPLTNHFISMPKEYSRCGAAAQSAAVCTSATRRRSLPPSARPPHRSVNVASFIAGIIRGMLEAASFPCTVTAVTVAAPEKLRDNTVFLVKLADETAAREATAS